MIGVEFAFVLVKPDAIWEGRAEEIYEIISNELQIAATKRLLLTKKDVEIIYSDCVRENYFPQLVEFLTSSPSIALVVFGKGARKRAAKIKDRIRSKRTIKITEKELEMLKRGVHPRQREITRRNALMNLIHVTDELDRTHEHISRIFGSDA